MGRAKGHDALFLGDEDRVRFLELLRGTIAVTRWRLLAFCLMTTHYHLLLQTPDPNLSAGMWRLNFRYAKHFNRRHDGRGHVFGDRYRREPVTREAHLLEALRYIARNPVRERLVAEPRDWRWSSHRAICHGADGDGLLATGDVLELFGGGAAEGRRRYEAFVG